MIYVRDFRKTAAIYRIYVLLYDKMTYYAKQCELWAVQINIKYKINILYTLLVYSSIQENYLKIQKLLKTFK